MTVQRCVLLGIAVGSASLGFGCALFASFDGFEGDSTCTNCGDGGTSDAPASSGDAANGSDAAISTDCLGAPPASWSNIKSAPILRRDQAAVFWTGTDYLVFGGTIWGFHQPVDAGLVSGGAFGCGLVDEGDSCNDGARYNPTTNVWSTISGVGAPAVPRWDQSFAFGANKLFEFGGHNANNIGGIYDLGSDTWKSISTIGAPSARFYHASHYYAAPTGPAFIVWGGEGDPGDGGLSALSDGAIYDVTNDAWIAMRTNLSVPGGAYFASATSDTEFFVWGGTTAPEPWLGSVDPSTMINTGAIFGYKPNDWIPMTTTNAPVARRNARAVWTGSKFIVWGGFGADANVNYNTGGMYDPASDTWTAMSTVGAPPAGQPNVMVWTGKRVVIWGILNGGSGVGQNVGGIFDPDTNTWDGPTPSASEPSFTTYSTNIESDSFWNGSQILVWAGYAGYEVPIPDGGSLLNPPCGP